MMAVGQDGGEVRVGAGKHIRAILLLPVMVTIVVPTLLIRLTVPPRLGWSLPHPWPLLLLCLGFLLAGTGIAFLVWTIRLLASVGRGTLAPWHPTRKLVVASVYRYVRNPMISSVLAILLGETLILGSRALLGWFALFLIGNLIYMPLVEERALEERFGAEYTGYRANVPAWIPRLRPWDPDTPSNRSPLRLPEDSHDSLD